MKYGNHVEHYKTDAEYFDYFENDKFSEQEIIRRYQEYFHLSKPKHKNKILEIGPGAGYALRTISKFECFYYPVDIATRNIRRIGEGRDFVFPVSGDVFNLPFTDESFDFILMAEVLEHLDQPEQALKELSRTLKSGGSLIISVPYKEKISYQICIHCNNPTPTNAHVNSFDKQKLKFMVESVGLSTKKITTCLNKISNRLHWNLITKRVPYILWKVADGIFNAFTDKAASLVIYAKKLKL